MTCLAKVLLTAMLPVAGILPALAAHTHVPTPSTWTLNLKESNFGRGPAMKSDVETVTADTEQRLAWTDATVDDKGKTVKTSWDGPQDGTMHPLKGWPGAVAGWTTATDSGKTVLPDGTVEDSVFVLSPDKKKISFQIDGKDKAGHVFHQKLVYDRTK